MPSWWEVGTRNEKESKIPISTLFTNNNIGDSQKYSSSILYFLISCPYFSSWWHKSILIIVGFLKWTFKIQSGMNNTFGVIIGVPPLCLRLVSETLLLQTINKQYVSSSSKLSVALLWHTTLIVSEI